MSALISTLNRHISALEKKEREFEKTYKLKPELCSEESLRGNDKAFWDYYSIKSKNSDILSVNKRIQEAEERIQALQAELRSAEAQQAFMENQIPDVIKDFFVRWKEDSISFFSNRYEQYQDFVQELRTKELAARKEAVRTVPAYSQYAERVDRMSDYDLHNVFPRKPMEDFLKSLNLDYRSISEAKSSFAGPIVSAMCKYNDPEQRRVFLERTMDHEMRSKMLDLAQRIGEKVGRITDAAGLHVQNGEIAGVIYGENGSATIQTIGAGGYNIQRFHFRTLVHELEQYQAQEQDEQSEQEEDGR